MCNYNIICASGWWRAQLHNEFELCTIMAYTKQKGKKFMELTLALVPFPSCLVSSGLAMSKRKQRPCP